MMYPYVTFIKIFVIWPEYRRRVSVAAGEAANLVGKLKEQFWR